MNSTNAMSSGPEVTYTMGEVDYEQLQENMAELRRLRNQAAELHTLVECAALNCKRGVRNQYAVNGMCPTCAEAELTRLQGIEARYDGSQRALSRLLAEHTELSEEAGRLRGIEAAREVCADLPDIHSECVNCENRIGCVTEPLLALLGAKP